MISAFGVTAIGRKFAFTVSSARSGPCPCHSVSSAPSRSLYIVRQISSPARSPSSIHSESRPICCPCNSTHQAVFGLVLGVAAPSPPRVHLICAPFPRLCWQLSRSPSGCLFWSLGEAGFSQTKRPRIDGMNADYCHCHIR
jgi:hypothetical protein